MDAPLLTLLAAGDVGVWDTLRDLLLLLTTAMVFGMVAERLGQSVIVGYLLAGMLLGPGVLGWIGQQQELYHIAELGVALLLFVVGLEFSPRRLLGLGISTLAAGALQVAITVAATWPIAWACGLAGRSSLVIGMMVALSSTACVLRLLADRAEMESLHGRISLGILLVQDMAVIPMILVVSAMASGGTPGSIASRIALTLVLAGLLMAVFYVLFSLVVPRLLSRWPWPRNRDLPILLAVIMALGSGWAAHQLGLSPALGAFTAGVLLAVSPFATQIRADVRPLSTPLVTLFFASIGLFGEPVWLMENVLLVGAVVLAVVVGKPLVITLLVRGFGRPWRYALPAALCLAQIGEFSFVLATIARSAVDGVPLISETVFRAMISATLVTLLITPYLVAIAPWSAVFLDRLARRRNRADIPAADSAEPLPPDDSTPDRSDEIMIVGFGPAGQRVAEGLIDAYRTRLVVLDLNKANIEVAQRYGVRGYFGDATQSEVLEHAGIQRAQLFVVTLPDHATTRQLIYLIRSLAPAARIIARCRYHVRHWELLLAGADEVVDEEDQVGHRLAEQVQRMLDDSLET